MNNKSDIDSSNEGNIFKIAKKNKNENKDEQRK